MEARIARLESDVAHLRTDVADIKIDVRSLAATKVWALLLNIALAAVNLGTLARGFGWI